MDDSLIRNFSLSVFFYLSHSHDKRYCRYDLLYTLRLDLSFFVSGTLALSVDI